MSLFCKRDGVGFHLLTCDEIEIGYYPLNYMKFLLLLTLDKVYWPALLVYKEVLFAMLINL